MKQIIYISQISKNTNSSDIQRILNFSRKFNKENQITGCLIFNNRYFVQILEGPESILDDLYARIEKDPRHFNVKKKFDHPTKLRLFGYWSMAFLNIGIAEVWEADLILPAKDFLNMILVNEMVPTEALRTFSKLYNDLMYMVEYPKLN